MPHMKWLFLGVMFLMFLLAALGLRTMTLQELIRSCIPGPFVDVLFFYRSKHSVFAKVFCMVSVGYPSWHLSLAIFRRGDCAFVDPGADLSPRVSHLVIPSLLLTLLPFLVVQVFSGNNPRINPSVTYILANPIVDKARRFGGSAKAPT